MQGVRAGVDKVFQRPGPSPVLKAFVDCTKPDKGISVDWHINFLIKKAKKNKLRKKIAHLIVFFVPLSQDYGNNAGLKENVFKVLEDQMSLEDFERWLYDSEELQNLMTEDVVLDAYTLNYKQRDAKYQFKKAIFKYFDEDEFLLWKVKSNLRDLIANRNDRDRILYDFYYLGYDGYTFLQSIGYYMYQIEDIEYYGNNLEAVLIELRRDSEDLLREIEKQESRWLSGENPGFRLRDYRECDKLADQPLVITKKWWKFWR